MKNVSCMILLVFASFCVMTNANGQTDLNTLTIKKSEDLFNSLAKGLDTLPKEKNGEIQLSDLVSKLKVVGFGSSGGKDRWSQSQAKRDVEFLSSLDADKSGKVSIEEVKKQLAESLKKSLKSRTDLDRDGDGRISKKEYAVSQRPKFGKMDADGLDGHGRGHFKREDPNQDGYISLASEALPRSFNRELSAVNRIQICLRIAKILEPKKEEIGQEDFVAFFGKDVDKEAAGNVWENLTTIRTRTGNTKVDKFKTKALSSRVGRLNKKSMEFVDKHLK